MTIPIAPVLGLTGTLLGNGVVEKAMAGDYSGALSWARYNITGVYGDGTFNPAGLIQNWMPTIIGVGVHIAASKLGVNRMLANAKVPYVRV